MLWLLNVALNHLTSFVCPFVRPRVTDRVTRLEVCFRLVKLTFLKRAFSAPRIWTVLAGALAKLVREPKKVVDFGGNYHSFWW